jgi:hypothetical protein
MAGYFKRKHRPGPSKNELKVQRGIAAEDRARNTRFLKDLYPSVQRLSIQLEFISREGQPFDQQKRDFGPSSPCDFAVPCPGRCGVGSFDLAAKVALVVESKQAVSESTGICQEPLFAGATEVCGFQLRCRIEIAYFPEPVSP